jgi:hypothetical protein
VRDLVIEWKKSPDGQIKLTEFSKNGPMTGDRLANYEAIAVEDALAKIGERFADQQDGDMTVLKRISDLLAKVAKAWAMDRLAQWLKNEKQANTEKFVLETIRMSGGQPKKLSTALMLNTKRDEKTVSQREQRKAVEQEFGKALIKKFTLQGGFLERGSQIRWDLRIAECHLDSRAVGLANLQCPASSGYSSHFW